MENDIPFGNSNRENGTTFLDFPLFLGIFQWDEPTKRVPFTAEPEIPEILTKWKAPLVFQYGGGRREVPGDVVSFAAVIRVVTRHATFLPTTGDVARAVARDVVDFWHLLNVNPG